MRRIVLLVSLPVLVASALLASVLACAAAVAIATPALVFGLLAEWREKW